MKKLIGSIYLVFSLLIPVNIYAGQHYIINVSDLIEGKLPVNDLTPRVIGEGGAIVESTGTFDLTVYNQNTPIGELSDLKTILEGWQSRTMELLGQTNTLDIRLTLQRNLNRLNSVILEINNPMENHFKKIKYFITSFVEEGTEARPLSVMNAATLIQDGEAYIEDIISEPDNLVKTYTNEPGGIKRAFFHNLNKSANYLIEEEQISTIEAYVISPKGEKVFRESGFKEKGCG